MTGLIVLTVAALLILSWGVGAYKRLVGLQNQVRNTFSLMDGQLKRRHELVPGLVETAAGYMKHERDALEAVIAARNHAVNANANAKVAGDPSDSIVIRQMAAAEDALSVALARMLALAESCPGIQANDNMAPLADELAVTENRIAFARQAYNDGVMQYNASRAQFPSSIIAVVFAFKAAEPLNATATQAERMPAKATF